MSIEYVLMKCPCGFCMTGSHEKCKDLLEWNSKIYVCGCKSCDVASRLSGVKSEPEDLGEIDETS